MDTNELSGDQATTAEELSEESADSSSSSSGGGGGHTANIPSFHPYKSLDELASVAGKSGEDNDDMVLEAGHGGPTTGPRFADYGRLADGADLPMALDKPKDYAVQRNEMYSESSSADEPSVTGGGLFRRDLQGHKEAMYSFCREIREIRQKSLHAALERTGGGGKDLELIKTYGLPLERMKDFGGLTSKIGSIALDRLRGAPLHGDVTPNLEPEDLKSLPLPTRQQQSQVSDTPSIAFERLRHAHPLFQGVTAESTQNPQFPHHGGHHHHHHHHHHQQQQQSQQQSQQQQHVPHPHHAITQITQMQHTGSQHQQHQQQAKSFTIDAILGLRGAGQRDKHARHHSYRKHQGQESSAKSLSASSCSNGGGGGGGGAGGGGASSGGGGTGGKLKRVRTIFTAEQLERLEGEFARQQYMVGPERLYLAHALRLTEAQVKVWFQNRRIKWRKLNHEQASQRLHELHQTTMTPVEREDSNENGTEW